MSVFQLKTFADLVAAVREELQIQSTDTTAINRIKRDVNIVYSEIVAKKRWWWLNGSVDVTLPAYVNTGTVAVQQNSSTITFSLPPASSKKDYLFALDGYNEIYRIESHVGNTATAKLATTYTGSTNPAAAFRIWTDKIPLPTDCKETVEVYHDYYRQSIENVGRQEFRRVQRLSPRNEARPLYYYTGDYVDPQQTSTITSLPAVSTRASNLMVKTIVFASGLPTAVVTAINAGEPVKWNVSGAAHPSYNGEVFISSVSTTNIANDTVSYTGIMEYSESATADSDIIIRNVDQEQDYDRYRELFLYPSLTNAPLTVHVDYIKQAMPLSRDGDEPLIPFEDRAILLYGALHRTWSRSGRNPEEALRNKGLFDEKLNQMESKWQDSTESAILRPSRNYLAAKRQIVRKKAIDSDMGSMVVGGSGPAPNIMGLADRVAIFGPDGVLIGSPNITTDKLDYIDQVTSNIQDQIDDRLSTALPSGQILVGNGSNIATPITVSGDLTNDNAGNFQIATEVIVDSNISTTAGILRTKLATGTPYKILANDLDGKVSENAALNPGEVVITDANGQLSTIPSLPAALSSVTLTDNQSAAATAASWAVATYDTIILRYSLKRGSANKETGTIYLSTDETNAAIAQAGSNIGTLGVTFSADIDSGSLRLRYTTTSTGTAVTMKYIEEKWLA